MSRRTLQCTIRLSWCYTVSFDPRGFSLIDSLLCLLHTMHALRLKRTSKFSFYGNSESYRRWQCSSTISLPSLDCICSKKRKVFVSHFDRASPISSRLKQKGWHANPSKVAVWYDYSRPTNLRTDTQFTFARLNCGVGLSYWQVSLSFKVCYKCLIDSCFASLRGVSILGVGEFAVTL